MRAIRFQTTTPRFAASCCLAFAFFLSVVLSASPLAASWAEHRGSIFWADDSSNFLESFGAVLERGDFNGDGYDDLAVSDDTIAVDQKQWAGKVWVAFGGPDGLDTENLLLLTQFDADPESECGVPFTFEYFGRALAAGDFNGDGRDDLAVGAPGEDVDEWVQTGVVAVFYGQAGSSFDFAHCFAYGRDGLPGELDSDTAFGRTLAVGDFDSDGLDDLAIGATGALVNGLDGAGSVTVIRAGAGGPLDPATAVLLHQDLPGIDGAAEVGDNFGSALATGDLVLGFDVACDLAIGVDSDHLESDGGERGAVHVVFGCTESGLDLSDSVRWTLGGNFPLFSQADQLFGDALAIGNFDCVGADDLAIGIPDWVFDGVEGAVAVVYGNQNDLGNVVKDTFIFEDLGGPLEDGSKLGRAMVAAPAGNGCDDLVLSAPGSSGSLHPGIVYSLDARFGIGVTPGFGTHHVYDEANDDALFGSALAVGRFNGVHDTLAVGAPNWDPPGSDLHGGSDGGVWVLPGEDLFADDFETGDLSAWSSVVGD